MVWVPGKTAFSSSAIRGRVSTSGSPVGGISNVADINTSTNTISETASNGATVGITAFASDATPGDVVTYSLTDNANGRFAIDLTTGVVTLIDESQIVFADNQSHNITMLATSTDSTTSNKTETISVLEAISSQTGLNFLGFWSNFSSRALSHEAELFGGAQIVCEAINPSMQGGGWPRVLGSTWTAKLEDYNTNTPWKQLEMIFDIHPFATSDPDFLGVANGDWNSELEQTADLLISTGHSDTIIRLWHEMDIAGRPRSFRGANRDVGIAAWKQVHGVMNSRFGANFTWQYSLNGPGGNPTPLFDSGERIIDYCYPGDDFVDTISVGCYNRSGCQTQGAVVGRLNYGADFAIAHGKGHGAAETGLWATDDPFAGGGGDNPDYIQWVYDWAIQRPTTGPGGLGAASNTYLTYYNNMLQVDITNTNTGSSQYPNARQRMIDLYTP